MTTARRRLIEEAERVNPIAPVHIWRSPPGAAIDMIVVAHLEAYAAMHEQAVESLPNETGGFLLGRVAHDQRDGCWHVEVEEAVPVEPLSQDPVHFAFTWRDVDRVRSYREEHGKALLGWYHTHPDLGIFLSDTDLERTHRVLFSDPFQIALVYDPVRRRAGYFFWEGAQRIDASQAPWREFDILADRETATIPAPPQLPAEAKPALEDGTSMNPRLPSEAVAATAATATAAVTAIDDAPQMPAASAHEGEPPNPAAHQSASETRIRRLRVQPADPAEVGVSPTVANSSSMAPPLHPDTGAAVHSAVRAAGPTVATGLPRVPISVVVLLCALVALASWLLLRSGA